MKKTNPNLATDEQLAALAQRFGSYGFSFSADIEGGVLVTHPNEADKHFPSADIVNELLTNAMTKVKGAQFDPTPDVLLSPRAQIEVDAPDEASMLPVPTKPVPVEQEARDRVAALSRQVYDAEADQWVDVTPEMREREQQARQAWQMTKHAQAVIVKEVFEKRLYLAAGFETREQYVTQVLGITERTAYNLQLAARALGGLLPHPDQLIGEGGLQTFSVEQRDEAKRLGLSRGEFMETAQVIQSTNISTLYKLTTLEDEILDVLLKGDTVTLDSGRVLNLKDLRKASAREATKLINEAKKQYKAKSQQNEERALHAETERDIYRERLEDAEATIENLRQGERQWGPKQAHTEAQIAAMESAERHLKAFSLALDQLAPDLLEGEPPAALVRSAASFAQRLENYFHNTRDLLAPLLARA